MATQTVLTKGETMSTHFKRMAIAVIAGLLLAGLLATGTFSQSPPAPQPAAAAPPANPSPQTVHYHYHYHYHVPMASAWYPQDDSNPNSSAPGPGNASYPLPPTAFTPAQTNPFPTGYVPGPFAPTGFQNTNANAPSSPGVIHVFLPTKDAIVYLNGQQMRGKGKDRRFTTAVLPPNQEFQYWVTATFDQNGETVTQYRKAEVGAGEYTVADFTRPPEENPIQASRRPGEPERSISRANAIGPRAAAADQLGGGEAADRRDDQTSPRPAMDLPEGSWCAEGAISPSEPKTGHH